MSVSIYLRSVSKLSGILRSFLFMHCLTSSAYRGHAGSLVEICALRNISASSSCCDLCGFPVECQQPGAASCSRSVSTGAEPAGAVNSSECSDKETARRTEREICTSTARKVCVCLFLFSECVDCSVINIYCICIFTPICICIFAFSHLRHQWQRHRVFKLSIRPLSVC